MKYALVISIEPAGIKAALSVVFHFRNVYTLLL
jgi:hypothetical protein